ncbi:hypothetical protein HY251_20340, partial [bacterium]|nr:hypothetical protein [bacterium]
MRKALAVFVDDMRRRNCSPQTIKVLMSPARIFLEAVSKPLGRVTAQDVERHLAERSRLLSPVSQAAEL